MHDLSIPLRLQPDNFTDNQWGGAWIPALKGLPPPARPVGEAWEFSAHASRPSAVMVGSAPVPLNELIASVPDAVFGTPLVRRLRGAAPFLLKFIDSRDDLSVQVHPGDDYARARESDNGKAESWVILGTAGGPGEGFLYVGFDPARAEGFADGSLFEEAFLSALDQANGQGPSEDPAVRARAERLVLPFLNRIPVRAGEVYDLPPGTIHAIGRGVRLFEIQQNSDVTYRVWDWNRPDAKKLREGTLSFRALHLDKAKEVLDFRPLPAGAYRRLPKPGRIDGEGVRSRELLVEEAGGRFAAERIAVNGGRALVPSGFSVLTVIAGEATLEVGDDRRPWGRVAAGHSVMIAAACAPVSVSGAADLIRSYVPG